jgi:hypothetical protein
MEKKKDRSWNGRRRVRGDQSWEDKGRGHVIAWVGWERMSGRNLRERGGDGSTGGSTAGRPAGGGKERKVGSWVGRKDGGHRGKI